MFSQGQFINSAATTPEELARKRAEIAAMMPRFGNARYVGEGLGQLFMGIGLGRQQKALDGQEREGRASAQERLNAVMGGGLHGRAQPGGFSVLGPMPAPTEAQSVADDTMSALGKTPMRPFRDAIASIESAGSGDYGAVGPTHPELGRALGRYQIMEANIGPWSREVLGREVTPEEFMANPQLQDAIFDGKFGGYVQQYGPEGAAQAWFAGPGGVGKMDRQDSLGTSVADYTAKFTGALGGNPGMNSPQMAAATMPTDALMSLMMDPWQPPEVRAMAQSMLQEQQRMNDPAYTMGLRADELAIQKAEAELEAMRNPTQKPLEVGGVLLDPVTFQPIFDSRQGGAADLPADFQSLKLRAEAAGLKEGTPEYQSFMMQGANGGAPAAFVALDMQAQAAGFVPGTPEYKEFMATRGAGLQAQAKVEGEAAGEAVTGLGGAVAKAQRAIDLIDSIAEDPALPSITGMIQGSLPPALGGGQAGIDLNAKILQLQGTAFLEAFESLKGGGAITEIEGTKAEQAIARLQRAQSTEAYQAALSDLRGVIESGMNRAKEKAAKAGGEGGTSTGGKTRLRFNPETGGLEAVQ